MKGNLLLPFLVFMRDTNIIGCSLDTDPDYQEEKRQAQYLKDDILKELSRVVCYTCPPLCLKLILPQISLNLLYLENVSKHTRVAGCRGSLSATGFTRGYCS